MTAEASFSNVSADALMNLSLLDPPRWGWSAAGGIVDLCPPHERARREATEKEFISNQKAVGRRERRKQKVLEKKRAEDALSSDLAAQGSGVDAEKGETHTEDDEPFQGEDTVLEPSNTSSETSSNGPDTAMDAVANVDVVANPLQLPREPRAVETTSNTIGHGIDKELAAENTDTRSSPTLLHDPTQTGKENLPTISTKGSEDGVETITVRGLNDDGKVDIFAYHRGRAGLEPRDGYTGELLCDTEPVDTNHKRDDPKLTLKVTVSFPLADPDEDEFLSDNEGAIVENSMDIDGNSKDDFEGGTDRGTSRMPLRRQPQQKESTKTTSGSNPHPKLTTRPVMDLPHFCDTIDWNLGDPETLTPMAFAADIATNYGLTFCQTLDLAASIQSQIDEFVRNNVQYRIPISAKDPFNNLRENTPLVPPGSAIPITLYGGHLPTSIAPILHPMTLNTDVPKLTGNKVGIGSGIKLSDSTKLDKNVKKGSVRRTLAPPTISHIFAVEKEFRDEVQKRAKIEFAAMMELRKLAPEEHDGAPLNVLVAFNNVCHICHGRRPNTTRFSCGHQTHAYCDMHCVNRLQFSCDDVIAGNVSLAFCPICCVTCICPKCCRRLDAVASALQTECKRLGTSVQETPMEVLVECSGKAQPAHMSDQVSRHGKSAKKKKKKNTKKERFRKPTVKEPVLNDPVLESVVSEQPESSSPHSHGTRTKNRRSGQRQQRLDEELDFSETPSPLLGKRHNPKKFKTIDPTRQSGPVAQVPVSAFPREMTNNKDRDPALENDYRSVFTLSGSHILSPSELTALKPIQTQDKIVLLPEAEDGSVDYCNICNKSGDLFCCDKCPRAFHAQCIGVAEKDLPESNWECPSCVLDATVKEENMMTGNDSRDLILSVCKSAGICQEYTEKVSVLSKIHEMILFLMKFDFGAIFAEPVDCDAFDNYRELIDTPMDLGTIHSNLTLGYYCKSVSVANISQIENKAERADALLDEVILTVLKDIETVWHNCFVYNQEGSAIFRMAQVQRQKSHIIRRYSFDDQLSSYVRQKLGDHVQECKSKRQAALKRAAESLIGKGEAMNEIIVPISHGKTARAVAVFNPESNMIVKQYSTLSAAANAAVFLSRVGYDSEFSPTKCNVKDLVRKSSNDPNELLFGYRWLYVDDLRNRRFKTLESERVAFEKGGIVRNLNDPMPILKEYAAPLKLSAVGDSPMREEEAEDDGDGVRYEFSLDHDDEQNELALTIPSESVVIKRDLVSNVVLGGFVSLAAAFDDWLVTRSRATSTLIDADEMEVFEKQYLHGYALVDGIQWRLAKDKEDASLPTKHQPSFADVNESRAIAFFANKQTTTQIQQSSSQLSPVPQDAPSKPPFSELQLVSVSVPFVNARQETGETDNQLGSKTGHDTYLNTPSATIMGPDASLKTVSATEDPVGNVLHSDCDTAQMFPNSGASALSKAGQKLFRAAENKAPCLEDSNAESSSSIANNNGAFDEFITVALPASLRGIPEPDSCNTPISLHNATPKRGKKRVLGCSLASPMIRGRRKKKLDPMDLNPEQKNAAIIAASIAVPLSRTGVGRREVVAISMSSLTIVDRYDSLVAAIKLTNQSDLAAIISERTIIDDRLYADAADGERLIEVMRDAAVSASE